MSPQFLVNQQINRLTTQNNNIRGRRVTGASDAVDPQDYVTLRQLKSSVSGIQSGSSTTINNIISRGLKSPLDFGGIGDGVVDDTTPVAKAAALGYLYLPFGSTFATKQLTITQFDWWCFGGGGLKLLSNEGTDLLYMDGTQYTGTTYPGNGLYNHVFGVNLFGNAANQPIGSIGACLVLRNAAYTRVQENLIYGGSGDGIRLENFQGNFQADEVNIINNMIFSNGTNGLELLPVTNPISTTVASAIGSGVQTVTPTSMTNIVVGATLVVDSGAPLEFVVVIAITGSTFTATFANSHSGGVSVVSTVGHVGDHVIIGNHCNYNNLAGIRGTFCTSNIFANNNVLTNSIGIYLTAADRCVVSHNAVRNNKGSGVIIDEDTILGLGRSKQCLIEGNTLHFNNVQTPSGDELDVFNTDGCMIEGNYMGDDDFTPKALYGIQLSSGCTGIVIVDNIFGPTIHGPLLAPLISGVQQVYRAVNNVGLADKMQGLLADLPTPSLNDYGLIYTVTDYQHDLLWIGTQWVFATIGDGSGYIVGANSSGIITGGVFTFCNGTNVATVLNGDGTTQNITTPNMASIGDGQWYMRN